MTKTSLVFRPIRDLELHLANMMTVAGIVFERHVRSAGVFPSKPTTSPLMNDPCTNAPLTMIIVVVRQRMTATEVCP